MRFINEYRTTVKCSAAPQPPLLDSRLPKLAATVSRLARHACSAAGACCTSAAVIVCSLANCTSSSTGSSGSEPPRNASTAARAAFCGSLCAGSSHGADVRTARNSGAACGACRAFPRNAGQTARPHTRPHGGRACSSACVPRVRACCFLSRSRTRMWQDSGAGCATGRVGVH